VKAWPANWIAILLEVEHGKAKSPCPSVIEPGIALCIAAASSPGIMMRAEVS